MTMTLEKRYKDAREKGRQGCNQAGCHTWDRVGGCERKETAGWNVPGIDGRCDLHEYDVYVRTCVVCGHEEKAHSPLSWLAEAGLGRFVCDPISGHVHFEETANRDVCGERSESVERSG